MTDFGIRHTRYTLNYSFTTLQIPRPLANCCQFSCSVVSDSLRPHWLQHTRLPRPSPTLRTCSNSCPSSWWCHPTLYFNPFLIPFSRSTKVLILFEVYSCLRYNLILILFVKLFLTISFHGDICVIWHPIVLSN